MGRLPGVLPVLATVGLAALRPPFPCLTPAGSPRAGSLARSLAGGCRNARVPPGSVLRQGQRTRGV